MGCLGALPDRRRTMEEELKEGDMITVLVTSVDVA